MSLSGQPARLVIESFVSDGRYAARQLRKSPGFALVAILTLALGIGATTAIFSVVYGVVLRPLPYPDSDRIVSVFEVTSKGSPSRLADPNFDDFRDLSRSFRAIAKYTSFVVSVAGAGEPTRTRVAYVSPSFLKVLGVQPIVGRDFDVSDGRQGAAPTLLVGHDYWRLQLGSTRDLAPLRLKIDGAVFSAIGVLPAGFRFPEGADLWLAADLDGENPSRTSHNYSAVARLRDGVSVAQASAEVSAMRPRASRATTSSPTPGSSRCTTRSRVAPAPRFWCCSGRWDSCSSWRARTWRTCSSRRRRRGAASWPSAARSGRGGEGSSASS
jgi:putative ABC transport system permease protein